MNTTDTKPEWIRLPSPKTKCPVTGLSRSSMNELCLPCESNNFQPPVKSRVIRKRKSLDGIEHLKQSIQDILCTPLGTLVERRDYGRSVLTSGTVPGQLRKNEPSSRHLSIFTNTRAHAGQLTVRLTRCP